MVLLDANSCLIQAGMTQGAVATGQREKNEQGLANIRKMVG